MINSRKLLSENPQLPLKKSTPPIFTLFPPKTQQVQVHPFVPKLKIFQTPPAERGWGWGLGGGGVGGGGGRVGVGVGWGWGGWGHCGNTH